MTPERAHPALPDALDLAAAIVDARARAGHLFVGLDFDGTLTPIVSRPELAHLGGDTRLVLVRLAARPDTVVAVLSGRALADVRTRVAVPGLFFAGNHGFEIEGPGISELHPAADAAAPAIRRLAEACARQLARIEGVIVEDKGVTLSVHFRLVAERAHADVRAAVRALVAGEAGVRMSEGKMVIEVRPDVAWDKGAALAFLRRALHDDPAAPALFIGDDRTDEDAFRELGPGGWGILVAEQPPAQTAARARLRDPGAVQALLERLARMEAR
ncbi:MAG TPA: trehalose-phosphatase [Longimicrobiales bacterium]|nr:trehalose-phosphatase [Longimicrobiales bacterium]